MIFRCPSGPSKFWDFVKFNVIFEFLENRHNFFILTQIMKIRPLSTLQLLKLKGRKWSYFVVLSQYVGFMAVLLFSSSLIPYVKKRPEDEIVKFDQSLFMI